MPAEDENDMSMEQHEGLVLPGPSEAERYWEVVGRSLRQIFQRDPADADSIRGRVERASPEAQEKFYQAEPYSVAADIAGETGPGTPAQQREYLNIRRETGYGDKPEIPPQLWPMVEALNRA
jgi:hypothetical protein